MEFDETWQEARSQRPLPSLCFWGWSEKQDGRPGLWLAETFSTSSLKPLNRMEQNLTGSKISMSSTKFMFFGPIGKTRWPPWPLIGWDIFDFFSETAELNSTKLDRKQDLNVFYQVCVFRPMSKQKLPPWLICQKGGTLYSGARYVALWASCFTFHPKLDAYWHGLLNTIVKVADIEGASCEPGTYWNRKCLLWATYWPSIKSYPYHY